MWIDILLVVALVFISWRALHWYVKYKFCLAELANVRCGTEILREIRDTQDTRLVQFMKQIEDLKEQVVAAERHDTSLQLSDRRLAELAAKFDAWRQETMAEAVVLDDVERLINEKDENYDPD